jgi:4-diphosphocytidyl-2-C-methyl-D-erythritol kinase
VTAGEPVVVRAPAKINVHLGVGPLRADGFHGLHTVYFAVSLYDTVTVRPGDGLSLTVSGEGAGAAGGPGQVPGDRTNLVWRAAELLAESAGVRADAAMDVAKRIPVAAGLAGGSADAAATLVALDALWGTRAARADLLALAAQLGSDVPFGLVGGVALGTGRGEQVSPVLTAGQWHWVLGIAGEGLSTPAVYAELDRLRAAGKVHEGTGPTPAEPVLAALRGGSAAQLGRSLTNDLQPAALSLRPELRRALRAAEDAGAEAALVSGSGPTVAALAADEEAAVRLAAELAGVGTFRTVRAVSGPVAGARLQSGQVT